MPFRPASNDDRAWLLALVNRPEVVGSLAVGADATLAAALERAEAGADDESVLVLEDGHGNRIGLVCWQTHNRRSRIAGIHTLVIDPAARGQGHATSALREVVGHLLDERGFHRVQAETLGFNQSARHAFQTAGFVQEGIRRRAYDRHGAWQDGVIFGLVADD
ncbi:MAG: GNAT N-acetyltransferase [Solirubrobacterales bacterium]|nr:GNAT N-acetyltransferase [Solirubrobacterales bacterium]